MNLAELKNSAKSRISTLEAERITKAEDFEIDGVGTIRIASPLPLTFYEIMVDNPAAASGETTNLEANRKLQRDIVKACSVDPVLDDEALDLIFSIMGLNFSSLANKCMELSANMPELEDKVEAVENFSEETPGPSSE